MSTRLHDPDTGRIVNVDDDQVEAFKDLGFRVVKGLPAEESDTAPKKSSK